MAGWRLARTRRQWLCGVGGAPPLVLAACVGGTQSAPPARRAGERITLRHVPWPGIPASRQAQTAIVQAWNASHPDVQITEEDLAGSGSHYQKLLVQTSAGTPPDLTFMQGSYDYVSFVAKDLLLPIDGFIKKDRAFNRSERLHPRSLEIVELLGHIWALPVEAATYVIFYNRNLLEQAGVSPPGAKGSSWTWQDLLDRARRLTRDLGGETQYGYAQGLAFGRFEPWIVQNGGRVLDKVVYPTKQRFDAADVVEALQFAHDLEWKHRVMAPSNETAAIAKMWEGKQALRQDGSWLAIDFSQNMKAPWGWAPLPKGKREATWMSVDVNVAFKATRFPDDCYEFLKFINKDGQRWMIEHWARMPVIFNDEAKQTYVKYLKNLGVENWEVAWDAWQAGYDSHLTPAWPTLDRDVVTPSITQLFGPSGAGANVATVLKEAAPRAQQILDQEGQPPR